jgi:hypothetical protein
LSGVSDKCKPLFNCCEAVVQSSVNVGAVDCHVQLSVVGILQVVDVERGDNSSDGGDVEFREVDPGQSLVAHHTSKRRQAISVDRRE